MADIFFMLGAYTGTVAFEEARSVEDRSRGIEMPLLKLKRSQKIGLNPLRPLKLAGMDFQ